MGLAANDNFNSPNNMATLPDSPYSWDNPGCVYLVPVLASNNRKISPIQDARRAAEI
jgi:hypothetical protein